MRKTQAVTANPGYRAVGAGGWKVVSERLD